jgi:hypothetical protein
LISTAKAVRRSLPSLKARINVGWTTYNSRPEIKKVYEEFLQACKKEAIAQSTEHLNGIQDLALIVGDYFFSHPQISQTNQDSN